MGVQWIKSDEASRTNVEPGVPLSVACMVPSKLGGVIDTLPMLGVTGGVTTMDWLMLFVLALKFPDGSANSAVIITLPLPSAAAGTTSVVAPLVRVTGLPMVLVPLLLNRTKPVGAGTPGFMALTLVTKVMF